jgi:ParB/RepB/Spo0J family partition protein
MAKTKTAPAAAIPAAPNDTDIVLALSQSDEYCLIPVDAVHRSPYQPRRHFDQVKLGELAESMKDGLLQPITVRSNGAGEYELIAGERRWRAAQLLDWSVIPAIVKSLSDREAATFAAIENLQRADLTPLEEADMFARLMADNAWSQEECAKRLGIPRSTLGDRLRMRELARPLLEEVERGTVLQLSHVPFLYPYHAAPEAVHVAALAAMRKDWNWGEAVRERRPIAADEDFRYVVHNAYREHLYPLGEEGKRRHGVELTGYQGPTVSLREGSSQTKYAADPTQWRPIVDAAAKERGAKLAQTQNAAKERWVAERTEKAKPVGKAAVWVGGTEGKKTVAFQHLDKKTEIARVDGSHKKLTGATILTTTNGRWDVEESLRGVDVPTLLDELTTAGADGARLPKPGAIVRVCAPYQDGIDRTATRDQAAVKRARQVYETRWAMRRTELDVTFMRSATAAIGEHAIVGRGARELLLLVVGKDRYIAEHARRIARVAAPLTLATPAPAAAVAAKAKAGAAQYGDEAAVIRAVREWLEQLPVGDVELIASALAAQEAGGLLTPGEQLEREQHDERRTWVGLAVPWIEGSGGVAKLDEDLDEEDDLDDVDDEDEAELFAGVETGTCIKCGCTDSNACAGGCAWLAHDAHTEQGVCSRCAATIAEATAMLDAFLASGVVDAARGLAAVNDALREASAHGLLATLQAPDPAAEVAHA